VYILVLILRVKQHRETIFHFSYLEKNSLIWLFLVSWNFKWNFLQNWFPVSWTKKYRLYNFNISLIFKSFWVTGIDFLLQTFFLLSSLLKTTLDKYLINIHWYDHWSILRNETRKTRKNRKSKKLKETEWNQIEMSCVE
jgi:hypothetical protein